MDVVKSTQYVGITLLVQVPFCISFIRRMDTQTALVLYCVFIPGLQVGNEISK